MHGGGVLAFLWRSKQCAAAGSLLPACEDLRLNSNLQAWQQVPLPTEMSVGPTCIFLQYPLCNYVTNSPRVNYSRGTWNRIWKAKVSMLCWSLSSRLALPEVSATVEDRIHPVPPRPHTVTWVRHYAIQRVLFSQTTMEKELLELSRMLQCFSSLSPVWYRASLEEEWKELASRLPNNVQEIKGHCLSFKMVRSRWHWILQS